ncbi:hypothetical protein [Hwanghaeella grinnelliae]|uniref:hypothetical protein n=1 Tax=Hwanghaeella grinnelliae TaxID=2500179 RepID=UPI00129A10A0|nr:hypothetical protein [Hwanghaeella grinnelliae]
MAVMAEDKQKEGKAVSGENDMHTRQRKKNIALALAIVGFCVLVYVVSIVRMSGG